MIFWTTSGKATGMMMGTFRVPLALPARYATASHSIELRLSKRFSLLTVANNCSLDSLGISILIGTTLFPNPPQQVGRDTSRYGSAVWFCRRKTQRRGNVGGAGDPGRPVVNDPQILNMKTSASFRSSALLRLRPRTKAGLPRQRAISLRAVIQVAAAVRSVPPRPDQVRGPDGCM